jgi:hypothetical protein
MKKLTLPPPMRLFLIAIIAMTLLSTAYTLIATYVFKLHDPYGLPLFYDDDRWFDFTIYHDRFMHFRTPAFWDAYEYPFTYPAPLAVLYAALYLIPHALRYYLVAYAGIVVAAALILRRALVDRGIGNASAIAFTACFFAFNYPLRTLFESANTEGIVTLLAAFGVWAILRDRCYLGAMLIALAGTLKIFPFILLALLLSKRRYREFAAALGFAALVNVASLAIVGPTIAEASRRISAGIHYVQVTFIYSVNPAAVTFNHSLFTLVKFPVIALRRHLHPLVIHTHTDWLTRAAAERSWLDITFTTYVIAAAAFGIAAYFLWIRRLPMLNQVLALTVCALLLPPLSADYTLLHLLFPFALLCLYAVDTARNNIDIPGLKSTFLCFAPIFSFQTYITWRYRYSCEFRTLALIALLTLVLRHRFPWPTLDRPEFPGAPSQTAPSFEVGS